MIIAFISMLFMAVSMNFFALNHQIQGLNRTLINTPIQLIAKCVVMNDDVLYFDHDLLDSTLTSYYRDAIKRYVKKFTLSYYFYNLEDHSYCMESYCRGVEVEFKCSLITKYKYSRTMYYEVKEGIYG